MISFDRLQAELQLYVTNSGLPPEDIMEAMTLDAARQTLPFLLTLARTLQPAREIVVPSSNEPTLDHPDSAELGGILARAGSDKSTGHNYHHVYAHILGPRRDQALNIFEVGLGTNNVDVPSNFGAHATPGSSVRAWRDYLPNAQIFGGDIDRRILFQEDRIKTFFVDQTNPQTFEGLDLPPLDLVIDDGLHSTHANLTVLNYALRNLKSGGWVVIEDIRESSLPLWHLVAHMLAPERYKVRILNCHWGYLFVVQVKE